MENSSFKSISEIFIKALLGRVHEHAIIKTCDIVFSPELIKACESNVCGKYGKSWTCPPGAGSMEEQIKKIMEYSHALIFTTKGDLDDSFDYEGMQETGAVHNALTQEMHGRFGRAYPVYGAGSCRLCENCAYPEPCRFPEKAFLSLEAAGINVSELSRAGGIRYNNGENTVTFFSFILYNEIVSD